MADDIDFSNSYGGFGEIDDNPHRNTIESFRLDNSDVIREIDLELRGWTYDPFSKKWKQPEKEINKFNMTDDCRQFVVGALRMVLHKANGQGNLSDKYNGTLEYEWKTKKYSDAFEDVLIEKQEDYNLSLGAMEFLSTMYEETVRTFFTRILGDGERKRDRPNETFLHKNDMNADDAKWGLN